MATIHSKTPCVCMHAIFIISNVIKGTIDHLGMPRPLRRVVCLSRIKRKKTEVLMNLSRVFAIQCCFKYECHSLCPQKQAILVTYRKPNL